ncbi:MAG: ribosome maturation factor RimP [Sphingomonadales bacterium]|jgi:ribosome maturation factor RimP
MANLETKLKTLVEQEAVAHDLFLVAHSGSPAGFYRFYVDGTEPVTMNRLSAFTRHVSQKIDEGDFGDRKFTFEISTPGADKPLSDIRQLPKHCGRTLEIETAEGVKMEAKLIALEGTELQLEEIIVLKGKKTETRPVQIAWENIKTATIKITFN